MPLIRKPGRKPTIKVTIPKTKPSGVQFPRSSDKRIYSKGVEKKDPSEFFSSGFGETGKFR